MFENSKRTNGMSSENCREKSTVKDQEKAVKAPSDCGEKDEKSEKSGSLKLQSRRK